MLAIDTDPNEMVDFKKLFHSTPTKVIKLIGFSKYNKEHDYEKRYSAAKRPFMKGWQHMDRPGLNPNEAKNWIKQGGWTGLSFQKVILSLTLIIRSKEKLYLRHFWRVN